MTGYTSVNSLKHSLAVLIYTTIIRHPDRAEQVLSTQTGPQPVCLSNRESSMTQAVDSSTTGLVMSRHASGKEQLLSFLLFLLAHLTSISLLIIVNLFITYKRQTSQVFIWSLSQLVHVLSRHTSHKSACVCVPVCVYECVCVCVCVCACVCVQHCTC